MSEGVTLVRFRSVLRQKAGLLIRQRTHHWAATSSSSPPRDALLHAMRVFFTRVSGTARLSNFSCLTTMLRSLFSMATSAIRSVDDLLWEWGSRSATPARDRVPNPSRRWGSPARCGSCRVSPPSGLISVSLCSSLPGFSLPWFLCFLFLSHAVSRSPSCPEATPSFPGPGGEPITRPRPRLCRPYPTRSASNARLGGGGLLSSRDSWASSFLFFLLLFYLRSVSSPPALFLFSSFLSFLFFPRRPVLLPPSLFPRTFPDGQAAHPGTALSPAGYGLRTRPLAPPTGATILGATRVFLDLL